MKKPVNDLKASLLIRGHAPDKNDSQVVITEMPLVLTLDQLRPNPDNPRITRNPKYEEIKASVKARGLNSVPKVTKNPNNPDDVYIFSDGGNTRYSILRELWQETGEQRFWQINVLFTPWVSRLKCVIGHLAENDVRGDLTFIEKALGIEMARSIYQNEFNCQVSQRELETLLRDEGYPVNQASISRMEYTVKHLYPILPNLLKSGLGRPQVMQLISLRTTAEKAWHELAIASSNPPVKSFSDVFAVVANRLDDPESYSFDLFKEELTSQLVNYLPNSSYNHWLIELDPKEQNRRKLFGQPTPQPNHSVAEEQDEQQTAEIVKPIKIPTVTSNTEQVDSTQQSAEVELPLSFDVSAESSSIDTSGSDVIAKEHVVTSSMAFANHGLEPVADIWHINTLQDDTEHLQDIAYRLAYELAELFGVTNLLTEDSSSSACGYRIINNDASANTGLQLLAALAGDNVMFSAQALSLLLIGSSVADNSPILDDVALVKCLRLIRILRRLREQQRNQEVTNV